MVSFSLQQLSSRKPQAPLPAGGARPREATCPPKIKYLEKEDLKVELRTVGWSLWERELGLFLKDLS